MDFTKTFHTDTYPLLSPSRPELSQSGKTIFITGGGSGVGLAISKSFVEADAARLIIVGRRAEVLASAKAELEALSTTKTELLTYPCDIVDYNAVDGVWSDLKSKGVEVDVLVLNATIANTTPEGLATDDFVGKVRETFEINVMAAVSLTDIFLNQGPKKGKSIISLNASVVQITPVRQVQIAYASSKAALGIFMQSIADSLDPEETQIISYHPGQIKTAAVMKSAWANAPIVWNTDILPGNFAVWATTEEARFLHGRFVWSSWDVEEMKAKKEFENPAYARLGLQGPQPLTGQALYEQMGAHLQKHA